MDKPYSEACERNQDPILKVLQSAFATRAKVLEIGSGTGQHAVHFGRHLAHLLWQPSDRAENLPGIQLWVEEASAPNVLPPVALDIDDRNWPDVGADAIFTANTLHIVSWPRVERLFERAGDLLPLGGALAAYGPFNYAGRYTSESNARFDVILRQRDAESGIRDFEQVDAFAARCGLSLAQDHAMPANNRTLVWIKRWS